MNSRIIFNITEEVRIHPLFSKRLEVLEKNIKSKFGSFTKAQSGNNYVYYIDCKLEPKYLIAIEQIAWIANGQFDLEHTEIRFMGIDKIDNRKTLYETRHWKQGTGIESALIEES